VAQPANMAAAARYGKIFFIGYNSYTTDEIST